MQKSLTDYRREAGYKTQDKLAKAIGVKRNTVSRWEIGERYPRPPMISKLAHLLNVNEGDIIAAITASKRNVV